jgi:O-antigen ligase
LFIGAVAAGLSIKTENSRLKHTLILLILLMIAPFLFTQSRSSYLGLVPVCFLLGLLTTRKIIVVGILAVAIILSPLILPSQVKNRILYTFSQVEEAGQVTVGGIRLDTSTSARLVSLKQILTDWPKHSLIGYGVTGYGFIDSQFPRVLIETGILGLISFFYLLYSIFKMAVKNLREVKTPYFKGLAVGFLAGFIGLLFHALGANTFIIVRIMEPFWFFAGIIVVLPELERREAAQEQEIPHRVKRLASAT